MGIEVQFEDGLAGLIPWVHLPEISARENLAHLELPNAYEVLVHGTGGQTVEIPWDFARDHADESYRPRVQSLAADGRRLFGQRLRRLRDEQGVTQEQVAAAAGISRVTVVRIEHGEQSPKYETLVALARALGRPLTELVVDELVAGSGRPGDAPPLNGESRRSRRLEP